MQRKQPGRPHQTAAPMALGAPSGRRPARSILEALAPAVDLLSAPQPAGQQAAAPLQVPASRDSSSPPAWRTS